MSESPNQHDPEKWIKPVTRVLESPQLRHDEAMIGIAVVLVSQLRACCAHEISHRALAAIAAGAPCDRARQADRLCNALTFACRTATSTYTTDH
jgi:hypothetical protein